MPEAPDDKARRSKRTRAVIDRIEEGATAVAHFGEDEGAEVLLPVALLPAGAEAGSHLAINVSLDEDSRKAAEDRVRALQERLEKRGGAEGQQNFKL